jgi:hypothetical protein
MTCFRNSCIASRTHQWQTFQVPYFLGLFVHLWSADKIHSVRPQAWNNSRTTGHIWHWRVWQNTVTSMGCAWFIDYHYSYCLLLLSLVLLSILVPVTTFTFVTTNLTACYYFHFFYYQSYCLLLLSLLLPPILLPVTNFTSVTINLIACY